MTIKRAGMLTLLATTNDPQLKEIRNQLANKMINPLQAYKQYVLQIPEQKREKGIRLIDKFLSVY